MYRPQPYNLVLNLPRYSPPSSQGDAWICALAGAAFAGGVAYSVACLPLAGWHPHAWFFAIKYEFGQILLAAKNHIRPWFWPWKLALPVGAALPVAIVAGIASFRANYRPGFVQQSGHQVVRPEELFQGEKSGVQLGGAVMSRREECNGILLAAGQGGGKTVPLFHLLQQVWRRGERALILDGKPEFAASLPNLHGDGLGEKNTAESKTWLLALGDIRAARWAVGEDVTDRNTATRLATSLTSALSTKAGVDFWVEGGQVFITIAILMCIESFKRTWDLGDFMTTLHKLIVISPVELREIVRAYLPSQASLVTAEAEMTLAGFLANLGAALKPIDNLVRYEAMKDPKKTISITRWINSRDFLIVGTASTDLAASAAFANSIIELAAEKLLLRTDGDPDEPKDATWLFLDEFGAAGRCDLLRKQMVKFRSKCVRVVLGIQSLQQLIEEYGPQAAQIILGSIDTLILGRNRGGGSEGDGEWASAQLGDVIGRAWAPGTGGQNGQYDLVERDLVPASEFGRLGLQWARSWQRPWVKKDGSWSVRWPRVTKAQNVRLIAKSGVNVAELTVRFPVKPELREVFVTAELGVDSPTYGRVAPNLLALVAAIDAHKATQADEGKKSNAKK
jgi:hypothetical protein